MNRGRPRKTAPRIKKPTVEVSPPEPEADEPPQKVVEVKHKTEWSELRPIDEAPADDEPLFDDDEIAEDKPRRRPSEREELKKKLAKGNITPGSQLKLTIERYLHSEATDGQGGSWAEREHCTKYICEEEHILSEDYLDTARKFGPGLYRFTVRMKNVVVTSWDKRISANAPVGVQTADGTAPHVVYQNGDAPAQPIGIVDPIKQLRESAKMYKELKEAFEVEQSAPAQTIATDPKIAALQMIAENPDVMAQIGKGIASTVLGKSAGDTDPWADVAMEAVKSGQAAQIVKTAIDSIFSGVNALFPARSQNGQAPMGPPQSPPVQNPGPRLQGPIPGAGQRPPDNQVGPVPTGDNQGQAAPPPQLNEADALIISLIKACEQKAPAADAVNIINVACYRTPELGESVDALINMSPESLLAMLTAYHPDVAKWEHAKEWLKQLTDALTAGEEAEA